MLRCGGGMITQHASNSTCFSHSKSWIYLFFSWTHAVVVWCVVCYPLNLQATGRELCKCVHITLIFILYFAREIWSNTRGAWILFSFELHYKFIKKACKSTSHAKLKFCLLGSALCELLLRCSKNWKIEGFSRKIKTYCRWRRTYKLFPMTVFAFIFFVNVM